jgi:DNA helicase IV
VIAPPELVGRIAQTLADKLAHGQVGHGEQALDHAVAVLTPAQAKGLEFDVAVVVEPATIKGAGARGTHDLYVCLTRPTKELVVVHHRDLPAGMTPPESES